MALRDAEVTVVGGGVGGLAAALALARRGARVRVLEQAPAIAEVGAGLQVSPNGAAVLAALGLGEGLARAGLRAAAVELRAAATGARVLRLDLARLGYRAGYFFLHRADLIGLLEAAARAAGVEVATGARVARVVPAPRPGAAVRLELADGRRDSAPLVVGADGVRSVVRAALNPAHAPAFTGQVAWRAVVPADPGTAAGAAVAQVFMAPGRHLVGYPLRGGRLRNLAAFETRAAWTEESWHQPGDPEEFKRLFRDFRGDVPAWLEAVERVHRWGLFRHAVAPRWHGSGCVLVGDAAHATLPYMAQGANLALEDAWVLAAALARAGGDAAAGLAAYQAARRRRCLRVVARADGNARIYHLGGPLRPVVHAAMRLGGALAPGLVRRRFDWIWGHDVTAGGD